MAFIKLGERKDTGKLICWNCGAEVKEAYWQDGYKVGNEVGKILSKVEWEPSGGTFILDTLIEEIENKFDWFDANIHEVHLLSFSFDDFTEEEIARIDLGIEELGAVCDCCKASQ